MHRNLKNLKQLWIHGIKKINPQVRLTAMIAMIATDSKPWIRLPLTDEGLQGLSPADS